MNRIGFFAFLTVVFLCACTAATAQTPNGTLTFGNVADNTTATTANTGFGGLRIGSGGGSFKLRNPGTTIGSDSELEGIAPTSGSVNSVGVTSTEFGSAAQVFTIQFEVQFVSGDIGTWYFFAGNGSTFAAAQSTGFAGAQVFTGLRFTYGVGSSFTTANRAAAAWVNLAPQPFAKATGYKVTIVGNNSAALVNYGSGQSVGADKYDLWVGTSLVGDDLPKAELPNATNINAFRFYGENSSGNEAVIALDNITWWNSAVSPVSATPGTLAFSVASYSVSESGANAVLTVYRTGGSSGAVTANYALTNGTASGGGSCGTAGVDFVNGGGTVNFAAGETTNTVLIPICNDSTFEANEDFSVTLSSPTGGATIGTQSSATVTIQNDDPQTVTVTSTADPGDGICDISECTLREAIASANSGDLIVFSSLFNSAQIINLGNELQINGKDLSITGPGANLLTIDGTPGSFGVFVVVNSVFSLSGITIQGGGASATGGGAVSVSGGSVVLDSLYISGNSAVTGGGIQITGTTAGNLIRNSTIAGNSVTNACGGIRVTSSASATIVNTTISGNDGSGAAGNGGGVCAEGAVVIRNSTLTNNSAGQGGGVYVQNTGTLDIGSSIVAGNSASTLAPEVFQSLSLTVSSAGFNLIGDSMGDSAATNSTIMYASSDLTDTNPQLEPLGNYGGPVPTHALGLSPASPVFDKGFAFGQTTDQRGFSRTFDDPAVLNPLGGDGTDIGAFERLSPSAARVSITGRVVSASGLGLQGVRVILEGKGLAEPRVAISSSFGYYVFDDVEVGEGYLLRVESGRRRFTSATRFILLTDQLVNADFVAEPW